MIKIFDYVFYRVYQVFSKQKDNVSHTTSSLFLTVIQSFTITSLIALLGLVSDIRLANKFYLLIVSLPLYAFNWNRYERDLNISGFEEAFGSEPSEQRKKNGWLIVIYSILVVLIPVTIGYLRHNLGVID